MKASIYTIKTDSGKSVTVTLKYNALNIFEEPNNNLWTFDLEGRLVGMFVDGKNYRRTLKNKFYLKSRYEENGHVFRSVDEIDRFTIMPLIDKCFSLINNHLDKLPNQYHKHLKAILKMDFDELEKNAEIFSNVYLPISILPPDQYMSLVIQLTEGCNYNICTFCNFYKDRPFKIKSSDELEEHINKVKQFLGNGLKLRKTIFLADANAVSTPMARLVNALELIKNHFPEMKNMYSFIDVFTGLKKSVNDFKILNQLGLKRVYLGIESGNNDLMSFLNKEQSNDDIIELTTILKSANINVGIIFLIGAGGEQFAESHLRDSLALTHKLPLSKGDMIYLSELYETNQQYIDRMVKMKYELPSKNQIRAWSNSFKDQIKETVGKKVQVSIYDINQFFY